MRVKEQEKERGKRKRELCFIAVSHQPRRCSFFFVAAVSLKEKFNIKQQRVKCGRKEIRERGIWEGGKELEGEESEEEEEEEEEEGR